MMAPLKLYEKLFLNLRVWGIERIPKGPKIYMQNHITSTDPYWVLPLLPEPVHVIIGPGYKSKLLARVFDYFEQINAMPDQRKAAVDKAVACLKRGGAIYTAPEGDIQPLFQLGRFYPGVAKIYRRFPAPIVPIALLAPRKAIRHYPWLDIEADGQVFRGLFCLRGPYCINIGEPIMPDIREDADEIEDNLRIMSELKVRMRELIEEIRVNNFWL